MKETMEESDKAKKSDEDRKWIITIERLTERGKR
jgi:hypothetical protein